jgi:hypothetical protein
MNNKAWQKKGATNNKAMKQQWGGGGKRYLKRKVNIKVQQVAKCDGE